MVFILEGQGGYLGSSFNEQQISCYRANFKKLHPAEDESEKRWDVDAFTTFLEENCPPQLKASIVSATPMLWRIAVFHSRYPFPTYHAIPPFRTDLQETLSHNEFLRAIAMLTGRGNHVLRTSSESHASAGRDGKFYQPFGRFERTFKDSARTLFQSLATREPYVPPKPKSSVHTTTPIYNLSTEDIYDAQLVVSRIQPRPNECLAPLRWHEFECMAARLSAPQVQVKDLRCPISTVEQLLQVAIAAQAPEIAQQSPEANLIQSEASKIISSVTTESNVGFELFTKILLAHEKALPLLRAIPGSAHWSVKTGYRDIELQPDVFEGLARIFEILVSDDGPSE